MIPTQVMGFEIRSALAWAKEQLVGSESASLDAQLLLAETLVTERTVILAHPERELKANEEVLFRQVVERRVRGEPLAYILGKRAFYDREFRVTPATLIPRPETEVLLEAALESVVADGQGVTVADVGTGCGALAICFAALKSGAHVYASDIREEALSIARQNGEAHGVRVEWEKGDLLQPWLESGVQLDRIVANLPYIATGELLGLEVSAYEPWMALDGGEDGLMVIRRLLAQLPQACAPRAQAWLEIGAAQGATVLRDVRKILPQAVASLLKDYAGLNRVLHLQLP